MDHQGRESPLVAVPGFVDAHTHLLREAAGIPFPWREAGVGEFHRSVAKSTSTPMDVLEPPISTPMPLLASRLEAGLARAAATGLVEVAEMGMRAWWYLEALDGLEEAGPLPVRIRIYIASGLAEETGLRKLDARRSASGSWVKLDGVKFYADGWLGPRTCATCEPFRDYGGDGVLFMTADRLARRIEPFVNHGWRIATHAIGDRGIATVLDAYDMVWGHNYSAMSQDAPRIEHASLQSNDIVSRIAESGVVVCIQPSFAVSDVQQVKRALRPEARGFAYPWATLAASKARIIVGTDYPIEVIEPLVGLDRLVNGSTERVGFQTEDRAPVTSRLSNLVAFNAMTDQAAGETLVSGDPRLAQPAALDKLEILGTAPLPFEP